MPRARRPPNVGVPEKEAPKEEGTDALSEAEDEGPARRPAYGRGAVEDSKPLGAPPPPSPRPSPPRAAARRPQVDAPSSSSAPSAPPPPPS